MDGDDQEQISRLDSLQKNFILRPKFIHDDIRIYTGINSKT